MVTRSDVLEKLVGRRLVSCLGWALLLFVLLVAGLLAYSYYSKKPDAPATPNSAPPPSN